MFRGLLFSFVTLFLPLLLGRDLHLVCPSCGDKVSDSFVKVARGCRPSVIHIRCERDFSGVRDRFDPINPFEQFQEELFNRFFGGEERGNMKPLVNSGSGFFVSDDGYIVTSYHVIKDASRIVVEKYGERENDCVAQIIGCDVNTDIAILKVEGEKLPYLVFGDSDVIEPGEWTMAIGHPFSLRDSVTVGVISATHRGDLHISQLEDFIQTDTSINPGNSGGPLLNLSGEVIGVNTAILSKMGGGSIGVSFSVPSNIVKNVYEQIKKYGVVDRAFLGVHIQNLDDSLCEGFHLKKGTTGAVISDVIDGTAAKKSGLKSGDIILECDGEVLRNSKHLYTLLGRLTSGDKCTLKVFRDGKEFTCRITLGSHERQVSVKGDAIDKIGLSVELLSPETAHKYNLGSNDSGLVVTGVTPGSPSDRAGMKKGYLIMSVNNKMISSVKDFRDLLVSVQQGKSVVMLVKVGGRASFISITQP